MSYFSKFFTSKAHLENTPYRTGLNSILRSEKRTVSVYKDMAAKINKEIDDLFPVLFPRTKYRGLGKLTDAEYEKFKNYKKGDVIIDNGFGYFGSNIEYAKRYSGNGKGVFIKLRIPILAKISRIHPFSRKWGESLIKAGSKYLVLSNTLQDNGLIKIVLKLIK